ncbi:MAG TPA: glycosyltransferase family 2 protein [Dyella sp.]|uniref:glycosyltransferase family 2 protein n=1 Tax=Dyella sp. TaxID=1869338 RepID=UPI002D7668AB|nr:glycosyltransferase family 2 protein [Dyella sp.]HET6554387.1 glycosyltransferase family 2 protein [Dyella sp.]
MTGLLYWTFWASLLLLAYVFVGYPAVIWLLARLSPLPIRKREQYPSVSVIIVVHDAGRCIQAKLANLDTLNYPPEQIEIIVACDGCTDSTARLVRGCGDPRVRLLEFPERRGKAACLNDAVAAARGKVLLLTDARQKLAPLALRELVANLADPLVGAASGELLLSDAETGFALGVDAYWHYEKLIRRSESACGSTIGVTGAIYAMHRDLFQPLPPGTVLDDVLVPMRVAARGYRVVFEPRALAWDRVTQQPVEERQRKIRTLAGNCQLIQLAPWLLSPVKNPLWLRFVSHKLLRLLAPWLLLALAVTSARLATDRLACAITLALLLAGGSLVLLGQWLPPLGRWLPVRLSVAFFYLNLFAAQALLAFARNRRLHLW